VFLALTLSFPAPFRLRGYKAVKEFFRVGREKTKEKLPLPQNAGIITKVENYAECDLGSVIFNSNPFQIFYVITRITGALTMGGFAYGSSVGS
jgi:hypothetical protein